jgi:hypothetical protein
MWEGESLRYERRERMQSNIGEGGEGGGGSLMEEGPVRGEGGERGGVWERMVRGGQCGADDGGVGDCKGAKIKLDMREATPVTPRGQLPS